MEEHREESDCKEPVEETGKVLGVSSKIETLGGEADDENHVNAVVKKSGVTETKYNVEKKVSSVDVVRSDSLMVSAGEEEIVTSAWKEVTYEKAVYESGVKNVVTEKSQQSSGDDESLFVAEDKDDEEKKSIKNETVALRKQENVGVSYNELRNVGCATSDADQEDTSANLSKEDSDIIDVDSKLAKEEIVGLHEQKNQKSEMTGNISLKADKKATDMPHEVVMLNCSAETFKSVDATVKAELKEAFLATDCPEENVVSESEILDGFFIDHRNSLDFVEPPGDLVEEIFSRLLAKVVARFRCVSKEWRYILSSPNFAKLFATRSQDRPRLLFAVDRRGEWSFYSLPQYPFDNSPSSSSHVVHADFHSKFSHSVHKYICSYASGLVYFPDLQIAKEEGMPVICNPITGQYKSLPKVNIHKNSRSFLGFDPIGKQFKVLTEAYPLSEQSDHHSILTLEAGEQSWRSDNKCPTYYCSRSEDICLNGVIYFLVSHATAVPHSILSFDVRSEVFKFIQTGNIGKDFKNQKLINCMGKLGLISRKGQFQPDGKFTIELNTWVLEDFETEQWSKHVYSLWHESFRSGETLCVSGMTSTGRIVLSNFYLSTRTSFAIYYVDPKVNAIERCEIKFGDGLDAAGGRCAVYVFLDHVEDLNVDEENHLMSRINDPRS